MTREKGFTLIEIIVSIFIITMLFTAVISLNALKDNLEREIEYDSDIYEIQNMLTFSKVKCKQEDTKGHLLVNSRTDEIYFYCNTKGTLPIKKIGLSENSDCIAEIKNLYLSDKGKITAGNTIAVRKDGEIRQITIGVGVDNIRIKE
ncbi:prepilin-type N-terminal cleavage/methylation domain-containing protein [uncultured Clostridium sp.]|uniref:prepilin-type N-terminal cleavage/methylation domain-containing protein n=1 Tax=uncultured Clostridium sp. TaxID=59620 RepID=UPI00260096FA|nr:prepilin-type N-terminal cleavage/methylation domain-containing protein [uncultured Clostridium sp.]